MIRFASRVEKRTETVMITDRRAMLVVHRSGPSGVEVILTELERRKGHWRLSKPLRPIPGDALPALVAALTGGRE